jgi:hypothetical protein
MPPNLRDANHAENMSNEPSGIFHEAIAGLTHGAASRCHAWLSRSGPRSSIGRVGTASARADGWTAAPDAFRR